MDESGGRTRLSWAVLAVLALGGCTTVDNPDPWEPFNRAMFSFNEQADRFVIRPVAVGYRAVVPQPVRNRFTNFLSNLREPGIAAAAALQGEREEFGTSFGRFVINSTMGVFGLFDAASAFGYAPVETSFDETFASWGVPSGPYVVLPLLGPNVVRGVAGYVPQALTNPTWYVSGDWPWIGRNVGEAVTFREQNIETIDDLRHGSVDPYATVRSIFLQRMQRVPGPAQYGQQYNDIFKEDDDAQ